MPSLQLVADLPGHTEPAWCVAWNPARSLLASCSTDRTVRLYSYSNTSSAAADPTKVSSTTTSTEPDAASAFPERGTRSLAWSSRRWSRRSISGRFGASLGVWEEVDEDAEEEDEGEEGVYRPHRGCGHDHGHGHGHDQAHHHEDDEDEDGDVLMGGVVAKKEWECVTTLEGHESECKSVGWSPDGNLLASCSRDKSVWVWEVQPDSDFECIAVMMEHSQDVKTLSWHPKEEILASASYDSHIHLLWDDPDGDWCNFQKLHPKLPASALTIPSSATSVIAELKPSEAERKADEALDVPPLEEDETVWALAWSPCGRFLASGGDLGGVRLWERTGHNPDSPVAERIHTAAHSRSCFALSWISGGLPESEGGLGLLASGGGDGKIIIWQVVRPVASSSSAEAGVSATETKTEANTETPTESAATVRMYPVAAVREAHGVSDVNSLSWCPRGEGKGKGLLASCGDDGTVRVWRVVRD
ncbi:Cytosolic iron-sulfur protein assembly protein [Saitozyma podzolica]|uniref:Probable cytosolic iron-sulfur protein assembly protein 1 n=1 Tax=Saitozyma podzolica TaxID=1890683 RepID=A0A427YMY2_9TREE|nr:Cytosolic iron-sulfur protein assembly protein [Saitozyma podzolica]